MSKEKYERELVEQRRHLYALAQGERTAELRGRHLKRFQDNGIHSFSFVAGRISTLERLLDIEPENCTNPVRVREEARSEANAAFIERLRTGEETLDG